MYYHETNTNQERKSEKIISDEDHRRFIVFFKLPKPILVNYFNQYARPSKYPVKL